MVQPYKTEHLNLFHGDNLEFLRCQADDSFDLALVDPPYGIKDTWSKSKSDKFYKQGKLHYYQNDLIPPPEYFEELFRVSKHQIIWGGNYMTEFLPPTNAWIVWDKMHGEKNPMSNCELAWTSFQKAMRIARFRWDGAKKCEQVDKWHPHQKPIKLYEWILKKWAKENWRILDTHLGSGTLAIAVDRINKMDGWDLHLTGMDIDEKYFLSSVQMIKTYNQILTLNF